MYIYSGYIIFMNLSILPHKVSIINPSSISTRGVVCLLRKILFRNVGALHARCHSSRRLPQNSSLGVHPWGEQKDESRGGGGGFSCTVGLLSQCTPLLRLPSEYADWCAVWSCLAEREMNLSCSLAKTLRILCLNFFSVCTRSSELIVAELNWIQDHLSYLYQRYSLTRPLCIARFCFFSGKFYKFCFSRTLKSSYSSWFVFGNVTRVVRWNFYWRFGRLYIEEVLVIDHVVFVDLLLQVSNKQFSSAISFVRRATR
jgi:hypothetical protein